MFQREVITSLNMSEHILDVGLNVGGDYKRTTQFDRIYEVQYFGPKDWEPQTDA